VGGVSTGLSAAPSDLPDEAFGAALAGLDAMTPRRLWLLARSGSSLPALWHAILDGRPGEHAALGHLIREAPELVGTWARSAARVDLGALWRRCTEHPDDAVRVLGRPGYPDGLDEDPLPPGVLFTRGSLDALAMPAVAIIGTRNATVGGMETAAAVGKELAAAGIAVVSGLAKGIDGAAHRGALSAEGGAPPIAVVGSGLDTVYPRCNEGLWEEVGRRGLLCSEVPPGTPPAAHRFPARNRILAALADVVVVVESKARGGSLLTVTEAGVRGVPVMAVPGSVRSPASEGTNLLLVDGATPVVDALDVLVTLGLEARPSRHRRRRDRRPPPEPADRELLGLFGGDALTLDTVVLRSRRALPEVAMALGRLELAGWLIRSGAWFQRTGAGGGA
jgi:DNA processing protein